MKKANQSMHAQNSQVYIQTDIQHSCSKITMYGRNYTGLCLSELVISYWSLALA